MSYPLVSIITPVYNSKDYIESNILGIAEQTYPCIEHIIVDGGSNDGTLEIIKKYQTKIAKWISEEDKGVFDAMNKGIKMATGEIVGILNSDDLYASEIVIQEVVDIFQKNNVDCLWGDLVYVKRDNPDKVVRYWCSSSYKPGKFKKAWMPPHPTFFVKKELYRKYGYFDLAFPISADFELMLRFLEKHKASSSYIPGVLVKMRQGGQSNRNILNIIKGNIECYRAFSVNGLRVSPFIIFLKPLLKIGQYFKKKCWNKT